MLARLTNACAEFSSPGLTSQSLSLTKAIAMFWPLPKKEKPSTPITFSTCGCFRKYCSTDSSTACDLSRVAAGGSWMAVTM